MAILDIIPPLIINITSVLMINSEGEYSCRVKVRYYVINIVYLNHHHLFSIYCVRTYIRTYIHTHTHRHTHTRGHHLQSSYFFTRGRRLLWTVILQNDTNAVRCKSYSSQSSSACSMPCHKWLLFDIEVKNILLTC